MEKEESLSDKRIDVPTLNEEHKYYYPEIEVRRFVKKLKEKIKEHSKMHYHKDRTCWNVISNDIKDIFGPKLS